jgi:hypothetical protein
LHFAARVSSIDVLIRNLDPTLVFLAENVSTARFALGVEADNIEHGQRLRRLHEKHRRRHFFARAAGQPEKTIENRSSSAPLTNLDSSS